jgi:hypothetical protein
MAEDQWADRDYVLEAASDRAPSLRHHKTSLPLLLDAL